MLKKLSAGLLGIFMMSMLIPTASASITYQETISSVVMIEIVDSLGDVYIGSGVIFSSDGLIITNAHVIMDYETGQPAEYIDICLIETEYDSPDCRYSARTYAYDEDLDLAILYPAYELDDERNETGDYIDIDDAEALGLPYVDFADFPPLLGDPLTILGYPVSGFTDTITLTQGTVSNITPLDDVFVWYITTDATINPGNSGGPAYDADERVVGLVNSVSTDGTGGNYGYIISSDIIYLWFLDLIDQELFNEDFVNAAFSNDYIDQYDDYDYDIDQFEIFTDVDFSTNNAIAISFLKSEGIVGGYPDGSFKPTGSLNRAELFKILVEGAGYTPDETQYKNCFPDVKEEWYAKYVCFGKEQGWVQGYPDGKFKPSNTVIKAEAMKMMLEVFDVTTTVPGTDPYSDVNRNEWYAKYIGAAQEAGWLEEVGINYWPGMNISRGQVSENLYRLLVY